MERTRVLIVDDQPMFRHGITLALKESKSIKVVGETAPLTLLNRVEAQENIEADVVIYGNISCGLTSLIVPRVVLKRQPDLKVIVMIPNVEDDDLFDAVMLGMVACIPKNTEADTLIRIVNEAALGGRPIFEEILARPELALRAINVYRTMVDQEEARGWEEWEARNKKIETKESVNAFGLTERELDALRHAASGYSNRRIAEIMNLGERVIRNQMSAVIRKMGVRSRIEAIMLGIRQGLILDEYFPDQMLTVDDVLSRPTVRPWLTGSAESDKEELPRPHYTSYAPMQDELGSDSITHRLA